MAQGDSTSPRIALVWEQYAPYHVDRCEAVAARLGERAKVRCIEIAPASDRYAWEASGEIAGAEKRTLFPDRKAEDVSRLERLRALEGALRDADFVILGLSSSNPANALLALQLRRNGARVYFCSDSKADDYARPAIREAAKRLVLASYDGGIVAGPRSYDYYLSLGVPREKLWPGYDTLSTDRIGELAKPAEKPDWTERPFLFLGRFVPKKAIDILLEAYAAYRETADVPRGLVLAGDGLLRQPLERQAGELGIAPHIRWTGFLGARDSVQEIARSLALVLPSREEQWGLVVNEAVALRIPVIASEQVGARDLLVRDGKTGFVVRDSSVHALAEAMVAIGSDRQAWTAMSNASQALSWYADSARFADTVEDIVSDGQSSARHEVERLLAAFD